MGRVLAHQSEILKPQPPQSTETEVFLWLQKQDVQIFLSHNMLFSYIYFNGRPKTYMKLNCVVLRLFFKSLKPENDQTK